MFIGVVFAIGGWFAEQPIWLALSILLTWMWGFHLILVSRQRARFKAVYSLASLAVAGLIVIAAFGHADRLELEKHDGVLFPGDFDRPRPPIACSKDDAKVKDATAVFLGDSIGFCSHFPCVIFAFSTPERQENVFTLNLSPDGKLLINLKIFDDRDNLVAKFEDGNFITTNAASYIKRPNKSALQVFDHLDHKVLDVVFLNSKAIRILGEFRYPRRSPIIVEEHRFRHGGITESRVCFEGIRDAFMVW